MWARLIGWHTRPASVGRHGSPSFVVLRTETIPPPSLDSRRSSACSMLPRTAQHLGPRAAFLEAGNGLGLVIVHVEDRQQLGNLQEVVDLLG